MGTITSRKRKDNSTAYTAQIRINRDGRTVYQESQTFDRKQVAQAWIKRRETELAEPGAIERANRKGVTIKKMIEQYLEECSKRSINPTGFRLVGALNQAILRCTQRGRSTKSGIRIGCMPHLSSHPK
jgi:hypothetical protein